MKKTKTKKDKKQTSDMKQDKKLVSKMVKGSCIKK